MIDIKRTRMLAGATSAAAASVMLLLAGATSAAAASVMLLLAVPALAQSDDPAADGQMLSLAEIESRLQAEGIRITEMEVEGRLVEVEGFDAERRKVELKLDRRTGEILSRKYDR